MQPSPTSQTEPADGSVSSVPKLEKLTRDDKGMLIAHLVGQNEPVADVRVMRCFPWTLPESFVSIRDADGNEIVLLEALAEVPDKTRSLIEQELRARDQELRAMGLL